MSEPQVKEMCPQCGASTTDEAGEMCIGEDCPIPDGDFEEQLRAWYQAFPKEPNHE
jgi:hypothetical protein